MLTTFKNKLSPDWARLGFFAVTLTAFGYHALILCMRGVAGSKVWNR